MSYASPIHRPGRHPGCELALPCAMVLGATSPTASEAGYWAHSTLTYSFDRIFDGGLDTSLSAFQLQQELEDALEVWTNYAPLHFVQVTNNGQANGADFLQLQRTDASLTAAWEADFGASASAASPASAVPEPTSAALAYSLLWACWMRLTTEGVSRTR